MNIFDKIKRIFRKPKPLEPLEPHVIKSVQSGDWNDPATWENGRVPGVGDHVVINHEVSLKTIEYRCEQCGRLIRGEKHEYRTAKGSIWYFHGKCYRRFKEFDS